MALLATIGVTIILPWTPLGTLLGVQPLSLSFVLVLGAILVFYVTAAENVKRGFYSRVKFESSRRSSYYFEQLRNVTVIF